MSCFNVQLVIFFENTYRELQKYTIFFQDEQRISFDKVRRPHGVRIRVISEKLEKIDFKTSFEPKLEHFSKGLIASKGRNFRKIDHLRYPTLLVSLIEKTRSKKYLSKPYGEK